MKSLWLLFLGLPTLLNAGCNYVHVYGKTYATGICYFDRVSRRWRKFEIQCGNGTATGQLLTWPQTSPGCAGTGTPQGLNNAVWTCGGSTCGFNEIDTCNVPITNSSQHQATHPFGVCLKAPVVNTTNSSNVPASLIYECCSDQQTVQQLFYVGTYNCQPGVGVKLASEFRFTSNCVQQVNLVYGQTLNNYVRGLDITCTTTVHCHGITANPTMQPTMGPGTNTTAGSTTTTTLTPSNQTTTTSTSGPPGSSTTTTSPQSSTSTMSPGNGTTTTPGMMNSTTTMSPNGTNTTASPANGGGGKNASTKKPPLGLIIGLAVAFVLILCLGVAFYLWRKRSKPGHSLNWDAYSSQNQYEPLHTGGQNQEDAP